MNYCELKTFSYQATIECPSGLEEIAPTLIELEVEKIIPFPLEEVLWNYDYSFSPEEESLEVTYIATNKKSLESSYHEALATGSEEALIASCASYGLFPPSFIESRWEHQRHGYWKLLAVAINFFLLSCCFYYSEQTARLKAAIAQHALFLHQEKKSLEESSHLIETLRALKKEGASLVHLAQEQTLWPALLKELHQKLPPRFLWITELSPVFEKQSLHKTGSSLKKDSPPLEQEEFANGIIKALSIEGLYLENPRQAAVIDDWIDNLKKSPLFALKDKKEEEIIILRSLPDNTAYAYPFKLLLPLSSGLE
ncbi:MAG: hypothetical protein K2W99_04705 [Chthoniobacterales bacterium]|nr:hypothetical protein [Chthoniobacterales bacterium]